MARLLLHGRIDNIQTSWVKLGVDGTRAMLRAGVNDLGGTLMEETISRMAGSEFGSVMTPAQLDEIATGIGRPARQRTTRYGIPDPERVRLSYEKFPAAVAPSPVASGPKLLPLTPVGGRT